MAVEKTTEEQQQQAAASQQAAIEAVKQKEAQVQEQANAAADKAAADANAAIDKANQALADLPGQIEDKIKELRDTIDSILGKAMSGAMDPEAPDFDPNAVLGKIKAAVNPVMGAISPVESVVGKVPLIGDLIGNLTSLASNSAPTTLSKEEIKKLVPNKPDIPPALLKAVDDIQEAVQSFCTQLPILLIDVIFQMLGAIYDMFDQIVGVIGVPPPIFPFSLVKQMPTLMPKVKKLVTELPSEIKTMVIGIAKDKMAEAQALAVPQAPSAALVGAAAKGAANKVAAKTTEAATSAASNASTTSKATEKPADQTEAAVQAANTQTQSPPAKSTIPDVPTAKPEPPIAPDAPTIPEVKKQFKPIFEAWKLMVFSSRDKWASVKLVTDEASAAYDCLFDNVTMRVGLYPDPSVKDGTSHAKRLSTYRDTVRNMYNAGTSKDEDVAQPTWNQINVFRPGLFKIERNKRDDRYVTVIDTDTGEELSKLSIDTFGNIRMPYSFNYAGSDYILPKAYVDKYRITTSSPNYLEEKTDWEETLSKWKQNANSKNKAKAKLFKQKAENLENGITKFEKILNERYIFQYGNFPNPTQLAELGKNSK